MKLNEAYEFVGEGWHPLVKKFFGMMSWVGEYAGPESTWVVPEVVSVGHRIGMLDIKAVATQGGEPFGENTFVQEILDLISWKIERESVKICEECGERGYRRKALPGAPNRCRKHYVELANKMADEGII
jgi:hypothetical protein